MIFSCLLAAALVFSPEDAKAALDLTAGFVRENPSRDSGSVNSSRAARWLKGKASVNGGDVYTDVFEAETPKGVRKFTNLYCPFERRPGAPWTVIVSHFDTKPGTDCPGANDGGSTSCLLVQLVRVIFDGRDFNRNVMLIWTDGEECAGLRYSENDGLQGSKRAAKMLKEKNYDVDSVYVLDMLGDKDLKIQIPPNVSKELARRVLLASKGAGVSLEKFGVVEQVVFDDHIPFKDAGFKSIDLIDFEYGSMPGANDYWHTKADTVDKLSKESFLDVGRLMCEVLSTEAKEK